MNPRFYCFDLEMNQPSGKIIQIAGCIGQIYSGEILDTFNYYINPLEPLNPYITDLTGISAEQLQNTLTLDQAWESIQNLVKSKSCNPAPLTWGAGDLHALNHQLLKPTGIHRAYDVKSWRQFSQIIKRKSPKGGLDKSLQDEGLIFQGRQHNALDDAINTFRIAQKLVLNGHH